jgi:hypothetical protein
VRLLLKQALGAGPRRGLKVSKDFKEGVDLWFCGWQSACCFLVHFHPSFLLIVGKTFP